MESVPPPSTAGLPFLRILPPDLRKLVESSFVHVHFPFGTPIVREGDDADAFYVIVSGRARVVKMGDNGEEISLQVLRSGDSFGEMALLQQTKRTVTVRASSEVDALKLDEAIFRAIVKSQPQFARYLETQSEQRKIHNFLRVETAFAELPVAALDALVESLERVTFEPNEIVLQEGAPLGPMYIVQEGRLRTFITQAGNRKYVAYLRRGDFFGERSMVNGVPRAASVEAVSACTLYRLMPEAYLSLALTYPDLRLLIEDRAQEPAGPMSVRMPLDFQENLPADVSQSQKVGLDQVDGKVSDEKEGANKASGAEKPLAGPFATPEGNFVKKRKRIRKIPFIRQVDEMDCGAACLAMVCRHFGRKVSLARVRQLAHTGTDGTTLKALRHAGVSLGLAARAVKAPKDKLGEMPLPAIVHWDGNHWVVLLDVDKTTVLVADPALSIRELPRKDFEERWTGYSALFDYTEAFANAPEGKVSFAWLFKILKPFSGLLGQAAGLAVMVSVLEMCFPVFTQVVVDRVLVDKNMDLLRVLVLGMVSLLVLTVAATVVERYLLSFVAVRFDAAANDVLVQRLLALPLPYFAARRTGDIQRRIGGLRQVRQLIVQNGARTITAIAQLLTALGLMLVYSPQLMLVFLATAPAYALLMRFSAKRLGPIFDDLEEGFGRYASQQIDSIKGIETVKSMGVESALRERMLDEFHNMAQRQFRADYTIMLYDGAVRAVMFASTIGFLYAGARQVMNGSLSIGGLIAFNSLVAMANAPIGSLLALWDQLQSASVLLDRLNDVFEQEPEQGKNRERLRPVRTLEGRVRFDRVTFQFGGPESPKILDNVSFEVPAGKRIAIVGRSGSGKTTLIKCLSGLLEPSSGTISYDGVDIRTLDYRELRRKIGVVLQDNFLFNDTIAKNIALADDEPDMDRVIWAARAASAHEFVERLPLGYETKVGESGIALSGGQKQRIAIARALYESPPVLIFDEATSALDAESERAVQDNLETILGGRTAFVIAHRLSTIRDADRIMVLEKGTIVEEGTHEQLLARQGLYHHLCSRQLGL